MMLALPFFSAGVLSQFFNQYKAMAGIPGKWVQERETHPQIQEMFNFYFCLIYSILSAKIRS